MRRFLGVDPGLSGAVALLDPDGACIWCRDTPTALRLDSAKRERRDYALADMRTLLVEAAADGLLACLESVHAFPEQGVSSTFALGRGFGIWLGLLAGVQVPFICVNPVRWKSHYGLLRAGKQASRLQAQQRWPNIDLHLKKHDGRSDAMHLADYARRVNLGLDRIRPTDVDVVPRDAEKGRRDGRDGAIPPVPEV